jgi:hypothetical protein
MSEEGGDAYTMKWAWPETSRFAHAFLNYARRRDETVTTVLIEHPCGWERAIINRWMPNGRQRRVWFAREVGECGRSGGRR